MSSVNKVTLVGNLGRDPEVRHTNDGKKIVSLSIATSEKWKDRASGDQKERTEWHRVVIFNEHLAGVAERFLTKGKTVYLEGQLQTRKWTDQAGVEKYSTEVVLTQFKGELVLLGGGSAGAAEDGPSDDYGRQKPATARPGAPAPRSQPGAKPAGNGRQKSVEDELDDTIPF